MSDNAQAIQYMTETVGWQLVEQYIQQRIEAHKSQLMTCPMEDITKHRAKVEALNGVLLHIQETLEEGREVE